MKKILKKEVIIAFIIGIILASSIAVYAYSYMASDIGYTKPGTNTEISVEKALNDLYSKNSKTNLTLLGTDTYDSTHYYTYEHTYDLTGYTNYQQFTENNFICDYKRIEAMKAGTSNSRGGEMIKSYNAETGILTLSLSQYQYDGWGTIVTVDVYLVQ